MSGKREQQQRCANCAHFTSVSYLRGECNAPIPFWSDDLVPYVVYRSDGRQCVAWARKEVVTQDVTEGVP